MHKIQIILHERGELPRRASECADKQAFADRELTWVGFKARRRTVLSHKHLLRANGPGRLANHRPFFPIAVVPPPNEADVRGQTRSRQVVLGYDILASPSGMADGSFWCDHYVLLPGLPGAVPTHSFPRQVSISEVHRVSRAKSKVHRGTSFQKSDPSSCVSLSGSIASWKLTGCFWR